MSIEAHADSRLEALRRFKLDRPLAHRVLFRHRHPQPSAPAHRELVLAIHSPEPRIAVEGFRGFGKSTYLEEAAIVRAVFGEFHNLVVVASSWRRACDRLAPIKAEFEVNRYLVELFGLLPGEVWQEGKIVLRNGVCIQALGREQSMLGIKHLDWRPDAALVDDVEDPEEERSEPDRAQTWNWFLKTFLPSLDDPTRSWVRVLGTRRGAGSLPERLEREGWPAKKYPIEYIGENGERRATWPGKFPLAKIDEMQRAYRGDMNAWMQEYMCRPAIEATRVFSAATIKVEPRVRAWETTWAMIDPARSVSPTAARTGWSAWSWVGRRLVVWGSDAAAMLPDEIVELAFEVCRRFDPVWLGVEKDGLEQWLMQPLRQAMARRGVLLPLKAIAAYSATGGGGQRAFVAALQPYFAAGEVTFAQELPTLRDQLLSFPYGPRDALNALAYAPVLRPGMPVYEDFTPQDHVVEAGAEARGGGTLFVCASATATMLAASFCRLEAGPQQKLTVLRDWLGEASVEDGVERAAAAAASWLLEEGASGARPPVWVVPRRHQDKWTNVGLVQAVRSLPAELRFGGEEPKGREWLKKNLRERRRGLPVLLVSTGAPWTLRALAGGLAYPVRHGRLLEEVEEGPYRLVAEGLESLCGLLSSGLAGTAETDDKENWAIDRWGRRYKSAMPARTREG